VGETHLQMLYKAPFTYFVKNEDDFKQIARAFSVYAFSEGHVLPPSTFYFIVSGEVNCSSSSESEPVVRSPGEFFVGVGANATLKKLEHGVRGGLIHRLLGRAPALKTKVDVEDEWEVEDSGAADTSVPETRVVGESDGVALVLSDLGRLHRVINYSQGCYRAVHAVADVNMRLLDVPFLKQAQLKSDARAVIRDLVAFRSYQPGEQVLSKHDHSAESFYIVLQGIVQVKTSFQQAPHSRKHPARYSSKPGYGGRSPGPATRPGAKTVQRFGKGQYFGGATLFLDSRGSTEAIATERTLVAYVEEFNFPRFLSVDRSIEKKMVLEAKRRLLEAYRNHKGTAFFADMNDGALKVFSEQSYLQPVKPSDLIYGEGEEPPAFFVVADGEVFAGLSDEIGTTRPPVAEWSLQVGQYFGEVGLMLSDRPQLTTFRAGPDRCTLLALPRSAFLQLFGNDTSLQAELQIAREGVETSLSAILDHKGARALFTEYLRRTRGERALIFFEKVSQYRMLAPSGFHAAAVSVASGIIVDFLTDPEFIKNHTSEQLQTTISQALATNSLTAELLTVAQAEIYEALENHRLADFKNSDAFQQFLQMLQSGNELQAFGRESSIDNLEA